MSSKTKAQKKTNFYKKVNVPDFTNAGDPCNQARFFEACYHITYLMWNYQWTQFMSLEEVWTICEENWAKDSDPDKLEESKHKESYNILKKVDPTLFC